MSQDLAMKRGDTPTWSIAVTRSQAAVDLTGATLWMTAKNKLTDADAAAVFQLVSPSGGIVITDDINGLAEATLAESDTSGLTAPAQLHYDVQLKEASGKITTVASGRLRVSLDATITT